MKESFNPHEVSAIFCCFNPPGNCPRSRTSSRHPYTCCRNPGGCRSGPAKVGVIVFRAAVSQTNEFQRDFADLQKKYDPKRQQLQALNEQIDTLTKQLQAQGAALSDDRARQPRPAPSMKRRSSSTAIRRMRRATSRPTCRNW